MKAIRVWVYRPEDRENYVCEWVDPLTGKRRRRTAGTRIKREADRAAANLERELNAGTYRDARAVDWSHFRERYEGEVVPGLSPKTAKKVRATFNAVELHLSPAKLASVTTEQVSAFTQKLRSAGKAETTIKSHLGHLRAAMRWARRLRLLVELPEFDMPKRTKTGRHRAITAEEFDRMIEKLSTVIQDASARAAWEFLLRGLWCSGLRLGEALNLTWDDDRKLQLRLDGQRFPMLWIPAELQKNNRNALVPVAPEFAELLETVEPIDRIGFVFNPVSERRDRLGIQRVGIAISDLGEEAKIVVNVDEGSGEPEYASAHDLRRAFGFRWSRKVMPAVLKEMMRHRSINTTMQFYAIGTAEATAATIWEAHKAAQSSSHSSSPNHRKTAPDSERKKSRKPL